jgi:putative spermidine/putrescine transport system permease protein
VNEGLATRLMLRLWAALVVLFLLGPIVLICVYAFNPSNVQGWPLDGLSTRWFADVWNDEDVRGAFVLSLKAAALATIVALVLGSAAAFAVARYRFFGRATVSWLLVLPIALPGIVTGMALNSAISLVGVRFSLWTIVVGHATFCVVVAFNNVVARLRRLSSSLEEASMDLGADGWQTFRLVTLPNLSTALVAGGLLAFALSFDEVIVTTFTAGTDTTLPIWIFGNLRNAQRLPEVNVVAMLVVLLSLVPVLLAQRLIADVDGTPGSAAAD